MLAYYVTHLEIIGPDYRVTVCVLIVFRLFIYLFIHSLYFNNLLNRLNQEDVFVVF